MQINVVATAFLRISLPQAALGEDLLLRDKKTPGAKPDEYSQLQNDLERSGQPQDARKHDQ